MRTLLLELRPAALLETRLEDLLRQLGEAASGREKIPVDVQVEGLASAFVSSLPSDVRIAFYRITQEALNNLRQTCPCPPGDGTALLCLPRSNCLSNNDRRR